MKELDFTKPMRMAVHKDSMLPKGKRVDFLGTLRNTNVEKDDTRVVVKYMYSNGMEYSAVVTQDCLENCPEPVPDVYVYRTGGGTLIAYLEFLSEHKLKAYGYRYVGHFPGDSFIRDSEG